MVLPYLPTKPTSFSCILCGQFSSRCDRWKLWTSSLKSMGALTESEVWNCVHWLWKWWCSFKPTAHFASKKIYPIWQSNPKNLSSPDYSALSRKSQKADNCMLNYIFLHLSAPLLVLESLVLTRLGTGIYYREITPICPECRPPQEKAPPDYRKHRHPHGLDCSRTAPLATRDTTVSQKIASHYQFCSSVFRALLAGLYQPRGRWSMSLRPRETEQNI